MLISLGETSLIAISEVAANIVGKGLQQSYTTGKELTFQ